MDGHAGSYISLYQALAFYFDLEELKSLCYDLGVEYENGLANKRGSAGRENWCACWNARDA